MAIPYSHLLPGKKFSDFATFVFSVPWFRGSERSCHISFNTVKNVNKSDIRYLT